MTTPENRNLADALLTEMTRVRDEVMPSYLPPCRHLRSIFASAKEGYIASRFRLTAVGRRAALKCGCIESKGGLQPRPPKPKPYKPPVAPTQPSGELSRNGPCWCGSGEKLKRCADPGSPHHARHLELTMPVGVEPETPRCWRASTRRWPRMATKRCPRRENRRDQLPGERRRAGEALEREAMSVHERMIGNYIIRHPDCDQLPRRSR